MSGATKRIDLEFAGLNLPVAENEAGEKVVPLKPITDVFGLEWERQRKKVNEGFLSRLYGISTVHMYGGSPYTCIRLERVQMFLARLSPDSIRSGGNEAGADYLEAKIQEWAEVLHEYEEILNGGRGEHAKQRMAAIREEELVLKKQRQLMDLIRRKDHATDGPARERLEAMINRLSTELGLDDGEGSQSGAQ